MSNSDPMKSDPGKGRKLALFLDGTWNRPYDKTNVFSLHQLADGYDEHSLGRQRYRLWKKMRRPNSGGEVKTEPAIKEDDSVILKEDPATKKEIRRQLWDDHLKQYRNANQIKFYDKGIGTGGFKIVGGILGIGLTANIVQAYRFICRHYQDNYDLYIFGFSRGSYTARSLTGVLDLVGIVKTGNEAMAGDRSTQAFGYADYKAVVCYYKHFTALMYLLKNWEETSRRQLIRKIKKHLAKMNRSLLSTRFTLMHYSVSQLGNNLPKFIGLQGGVGDLSAWETLIHLQRRLNEHQNNRQVSRPDDAFYNELLNALKDLKSKKIFKDSVTKPQIKFLGVFDTVGSLGIPNSLLYQGIFRDRHADRFHNTVTSSVVQNAFHALAIDEKRIDFIPTLFRKNGKSEQTIVQMWFAGAHSNVGGGYEDNFLNRIPGRWMQAWASHHGLKFQQMIRCGPSDLTEPIVDSRKWPFKYLAPIFRFIPLDLNKDEGKHYIHSSVRRYCLQHRDYFPTAVTQGKLKERESEDFDWPATDSNPFLDNTSPDQKKQP